MARLCCTAVLLFLPGCFGAPVQQQSETAGEDICAVSATVRGSIEDTIEWSTDEIDCFGDHDIDHTDPLQMWYTKIQNVHEMFIYVDVELEQTGTFDAFISAVLYSRVYSGLDANCQAQVDTFRRRDDQEGHPSYEVRGTAECANPLPDINGTGGPIELSDIHFGMQFVEMDLGL